MRREVVRREFAVFFGECALVHAGRGPGAVSTECGTSIIFTDCPLDGKRYAC